MISFLKNNINRLIAILSSLVVTAVALWLTIVDDSSDKKVGTIISVIGSMASIYAIIETIIRIASISQKQEKIRQEINKKVIFLDKREAIMDISQHAEICSDAINMLRVENIEATLIHLEKLNQFVIQIKNIPSLGLENDEVLQMLCNRLAVDLSTLRNIEPKTKSGLLFTKSNIIERCSELQQYLCTLKNRLKYEEHEE